MLTAKTKQAGADIRAERLAKGWTIEELSERTGIDEVILTCIEMGELCVGREDWSLLCSLLDPETRDYPAPAYYQLDQPLDMATAHRKGRGPFSTRSRPWIDICNRAYDFPEAQLSALIRKHTSRGVVHFHHNTTLEDGPAHLKAWLALAHELNLDPALEWPRRKPLPKPELFIYTKASQRSWKYASEEYQYGRNEVSCCVLAHALWRARMRHRLAELRQYQIALEQHPFGEPGVPKVPQQWTLFGASRQARLGFERVKMLETSRYIDARHEPSIMRLAKLYAIPDQEARLMLGESRPPKKVVSTRSSWRAAVLERLHFHRINIQKLALVTGMDIQKLEVLMQTGEVRQYPKLARDLSSLLGVAIPDESELARNAELNAERQAVRLRHLSGHTRWGDKLIERRVEAGMTQLELACVIGCTVASLRNAETLQKVAPGDENYYEAFEAKHEQACAIPEVLTDVFEDVTLALYEEQHEA